MFSFACSLIALLKLQNDLKYPLGCPGDTFISCTKSETEYWANPYGKINKQSNLSVGFSGESSTYLGYNNRKNRTNSSLQHMKESDQKSVLPPEWLVKHNDNNRNFTCSQHSCVVHIAAFVRQINYVFMEQATWDLSRNNGNKNQQWSTVQSFTKSISISAIQLSIKAKFKVCW